MKKIILLIATFSFFNMRGMESQASSPGETQLMLPQQVLDLAQKKSNPSAPAHTPTEIIATGTQDEIIELLQNGFDPNTYIKYDGRSGTVHHWAAKNGYVKVFDCIKAKYPDMSLNFADLNPADQSGSRWTPLHVAAFNGKSEIFSWFKVNCPDMDLNPAIIEGPDKGWNPLHIAARNGKSEIFSWFKINCPDMDLNPAISDGTYKGYTLLHAAARNGKSEIINWFKVNCPGMDLNPTILNGNNQGTTPLICSFLGNYKEIGDLVPSSLTRPPKCCYLSFEQKDVDQAVEAGLMVALLDKVLAIVTPQMLVGTMRDSSSLKEYCNSGKFTVLASGPTDLVVIIPESLNEMGIFISDSEKQKKEPCVDITPIYSKYGLKNLHLISPLFLASAFDNAQIKTTDELVKNLELVINATSEDRPSRFYLCGHGIYAVGFYHPAPGIIAAISSPDIKNFFTTLSTLGAEFLFINSCYSAGTNLLALQNAIREIDYPVVLKVTSGIVSAGTINSNAMFTKLDEFLKNDSFWALEFAADKDKRRPAIADVIAASGPQYPVSLPSIRLPGKFNFFRAIDRGEMEIITTSKIIEKGVSKTLELVAQSKNSDKAIADEAKQKLRQPLEIEFQIKPDVQYVQIFPTDLTDFKFVIQGSTLPKFISKQPGTGQHFIGEITYNSNEKDETSARTEFIDNGFVKIFGIQFYAADSSKCWFIKSAQLSAAGKRTIIKKLVILVPEYPYVNYAYINENNEFILSKYGEKTESKVDKEAFESTIKSWFNATKASQETLNEATGGVEITSEEKEKLSKGQSTNFRLINPQYQRTPDDLFNMFMAAEPVPGSNHE